jgi:hypothetical protein
MEAIVKPGEMFQVEVAIFQRVKPTKKRCIYSVVRIKSSVWKGVKNDIGLHGGWNARAGRL